MRIYWDHELRTNPPPLPPWLMPLPPIMPPPPMMGPGGLLVAPGAPPGGLLAPPIAPPGALLPPGALPGGPPGALPGFPALGAPSAPHPIRFVPAGVQGAGLAVAAGAVVAGRDAGVVKMEGAGVAAGVEAQ